MPLYKRKGSPFWQYSFTVDGVRFRGSTGETGKREAARVEAERLHQYRHATVPRDNWTLAHCLAIYWQDQARHKRSSEVTLHKLGKLREHLDKDKPIMALTNVDLLEYRAKRRGEGLEPHSVNRDFAYLKAALRHAQQMHGQQVPSLAWRELKATEPTGRTRYLSRTEYSQLLEHCDDALALLVRFAVATGLRKTNILTLDWRNVDLDSGRVSVILKGNKPHVVTLPAEMRAALSTLPDRQGKVFDSHRFRRRWEKAVKAAGLKDFRFHDLRHTCASWMRMAGVDIADICDALGHSSVTVTMRYAHVMPEEHISPFDRISSRVWSQSVAQLASNRRNS